MQQGVVCILVPLRAGAPERLVSRLCEHDLVDGEEKFTLAGVSVHVLVLWLAG